MIALGIKGTDAVLHPEVHVDESIAKTPAMVEAPLGFTDAVTAQIQLAVFDVVVGAQVGQAGAQSGLAQRVAVDDSFGVQLVILAVAGLLEPETIGLCLGAVIALAVAVVEGPPAIRKAVIEEGIVGGALMIADGVMAAPQHQLVSQPQRTVPIQGGPPLLFAGALLPIIATQ